MNKFVKILTFVLGAVALGNNAAAQTCAPAPSFSVSIDRAAKQALLDSIYVFMNATYVFPDKTAGIIDEMKRRFEGGVYDSLATTDGFASALTQDLRTVTGDLHFAVAIRPPGSKENFCAATSTDTPALREINHGFKTVQVLPGNIGYLELTACTDAALGGATADAAMQFLSGTRALVIDLRNNSGGVTSMGLYLASYLFAPRKLMHSIARRDETGLEQFRTAAHVNGQRRLDIPVYILTSSRTASSAESFAYDLKHHGRATIVGERTAGAGHCAERTRVEFTTFQADIMVPTYQPVHPVTGSNWEGSGVSPDIAAPADDALDVAYRKALESVQPGLSPPPGPPRCAPSGGGCPETSQTRDREAGVARVSPPGSRYTEIDPVELLSNRFSERRRYEEAVFDAILDLYREYDVVHIGERHWNMTDYEFRTAFVEYPAFAEVVDDIVIESGNYLYQGVLDDYILRLDDVPDEELCKVWRNSVATSGVWDATIYKHFIHTIRHVNETLPPQDRIRLIASEPPIDWSNVASWEDIKPFLCQRSTHTPEVVKTEVLNRNRKAMIFYGGAHFFRSSNVVPECGRLRARLEQISGQKVFTILPLSGDTRYSRAFRWHTGNDTIPLFLRVRESELGSLPGDLFFSEAAGTLAGFTDGVLYFGTQTDRIAELDPDAANDADYQRELSRRRRLFEEWSK